MRRLDNFSRAFYLRDFGGSAPEATMPSVLLTSSGDSPRMEFRKSSGPFGSLGFGAGSMVLALRNEQNSNIELWTAGARRWYVDSSGNLVPGANYGYDIGICSVRPRSIYVSGIVTSNNDTNSDGPNFVVDTSTKGTNLMAYDVRRAGTSVGGFTVAGAVNASGLSVSGNASFATAVCTNAGIVSSGPVVITGNSGLYASYGLCCALASGFGSPNSGRLFIGDGSGWKFYVSQKHGPLMTDISDLMSFTDGGLVGIGTTSPGNLLTVNSGVTPNASQARVSANGAGGIALLCYQPDNCTLSFDADYGVVSGSTGWIMRDNSGSSSRAALFLKQGGSLWLQGGTGSTGAIFSPANLLNFNLATGSILPKTGTATSGDATNRWTGIYGVAGDFSGNVNVTGTLNANAGFTLNGATAPFVPVGGIIAWLAQWAGKPTMPQTLPPGFVLCDGVTSITVGPFTGTTPPLLNGTTNANKCFLRGAQSPSGICTSTMNHHHAITVNSISNLASLGAGSCTYVTSVTNPTGDFEPLPTYCEVMYIMRII